MNVTMTLNGEQKTVAVEPDEMLLAVLHRLGLRSVRETCGIGVCGSCTVLLDGRPVSGCLLLAPLADGGSVITAEGLSDDPVTAAFAESHAYQCGWCTPGFVVAVRGLLDENPAPSENDAKEALAGNLCRCGSYLKILDAVQTAGAGR
jgi:aerobic-type carbon monoxide dehydrogenase small subunit (CoxS/CutS family)